MAHIFGGLNLPGNWQTWGVAAAGLASCLAGLVLGRRLFVRSPGAPPVAAPAAPPPPPDPFEFGSSSEKRAALRRKGAFVEVLVTDEAQQQHPWSAWVVDRSLGGLCLSVEREVEPGTVLRVRPRNAASMAPWVEVEVKSCKTEEGVLLLGCAFRKTPPYSVLLLFN